MEVSAESSDLSQNAGVCFLLPANDRKPLLLCSLPALYSLHMTYCMESQLAWTAGVPE